MLFATHRVWVSLYNRNLKGFNSSGDSDPTDTIFVVPVECHAFTGKPTPQSLEKLLVLTRYARFIAMAGTAKLYYVRSPAIVPGLSGDCGRTLKENLSKLYMDIARESTLSDLINLIGKG